MWFQENRYGEGNQGESWLVLGCYLEPDGEGFERLSFELEALRKHKTPEDLEEEDAG